MELEEAQDLVLENALLEEDVDHKYFYDGTLTGWLSKYSKLVWGSCICLVLLTFVLVLLVVYVGHVFDRVETDDDDACWPFDCYSSAYADFESSFYYEAPDSDTSSINATLIGDWDFVHPSPTNRDLRSVAFGAGVFVAVGQDNSQLFYDPASPAPATWLLEAPIDRSVRGATYGSVYSAADHFFTASSTGAGYSRVALAGLPWSQSEHSFSEGIAADVAGEVYVGLEAGTVWRCDVSVSADLWEQVELPGEIASLDAVSHFNSKFLVVGSTVRSAALVDEFLFSSWYSHDGITWVQTVDVEGEPLRNSEHILLASVPTREADRGNWLAFADQLLHSADGETWSAFESSPWNEFSVPRALACTMYYCVAVTSGGGGTQSMVSVTEDGGTSWQSAVVSRTLLDVISDGADTFVAVGGGGTVLQGSVNATAGAVTLLWQEVGAAGRTLAVRDVAFGGGGFLATTEGDQLLVSADGETWEAQVSPPFAHVAHGDAAFAGVVAGARQMDLYAADDEAMEWAVVGSFAGEYDVRSLTYDGHQFLGVGRRCLSCAQDDDDDDDDSYVPVVVQSDGGDEWEVVEVVGVESFLVEAVWNSRLGNYLALSHAGALYTSKDLREWAKMSSTSHTYLSVTVDQHSGTYVALGKDGTRPALRSSTDAGHTWTTAPCRPSPLLTQVDYSFATQELYLSGGSFCRAQADLSHLECNSFRMEINSAQAQAVGNGIVVVLSEGGLVTAAMQELDFDDACSA